MTCVLTGAHTEFGNMLYWYMLHTNACLHLLLAIRLHTDHELASIVTAGKHIAEALGLNYVFFCEFEELKSPLRSKAAQVW